MPPLRPLSWRPLPWGALALMLLGTLGAAWAVRSAESARFAQAEQAQVEATTERLDRRMRTLVQILKGASGYLAREGRLPDRQAWREYVAGLEFFRTYPGVQGMGFVQWIPTHARSARVRGEPPPGDGGPPGEPLPADPAGHSVILYLEPLDERNQRALGRDMWAEAIRRAAMARARDFRFILQRSPTVDGTTVADSADGPVCAANTARR